MSDVKRYTPLRAILPSPDGEYVRWEDYEALFAQSEVWRRQVVTGVFDVGSIGGVMTTRAHMARLAAYDKLATKAERCRNNFGVEYDPDDMQRIVDQIAELAP